MLVNTDRVKGLTLPPALFDQPRGGNLHQVIFAGKGRHSRKVVLQLPEQRGVYRGILEETSGVPNLRWVGKLPCADVDNGVTDRPNGEILYVFLL